MLCNVQQLWSGGMATAVNTVPGSGVIPPVDMPNPTNKPTKRTEAPNAFSVNEPGQPLRTGNNAQELAASLGKIVDWLAPEDAAHTRYQPTASATFCNIYAHDYCYLVGVYLPRVWWNQSALAKWAAGGTVTPDYGVTIEEMTANALVPWLKQYGPTFGWRPGNSLSELQDEANKGAAVVIAGRAAVGHGHIVAVVPEVGAHVAKRDANGQVATPLQSQAGRRNFDYGFLQPNWWPSHAEFGLWIHA
jgi:hypothetical protein